MKFWLLAYQHRHGMDFFLYEGEDQARYAAAVLAVRESASECTAEIALQIEGFFNLGHREEALQLYCDHVDEMFHVRPVEVVSGRRFAMTIAEANTEVVHVTRGWPHGDIEPGVTWCGRSFWWAAQTVPLAAASFRAWIPKEPRHVTCLGCSVAEGVR